MSLKVAIILLFGILCVYGNVSAATVTYYVSLSGNDSNNGTSLGSAFRTIQKAADMGIPQKALNNDVEILIASGIYRESVSIIRNGDDPSTDNASTFTIKAIVPHTVIIDGSDLFPTGWTLSGGLYERTWTGDRGEHPASAVNASSYTSAAPVVKRRELVTVNDIMYRQVVFGDSVPTANCPAEINSSRGGNGVFCVDDSLNRMYVKLLPGHSISTSTIGVNRINDDGIYRNPTFVMQNFSGVTIDGIIFQRGATRPVNDGMVIMSWIKGLNFKNNIIRENAGVGMWFIGGFLKTRNEESYFSGFVNNVIHIMRSRNLVFENNDFSQNGSMGFSLIRSSSAIIKNNMISGNLFRNDRARYYPPSDNVNPDDANSGIRYDRATAGDKSSWLANVDYIGNSYINNRGYGLWFDIHNMQINIIDNTFWNNLAGGIHVEISKGYVIKNNLIGRAQLSSSSGLKLIENIITNDLSDYFTAHFPQSLSHRSVSGGRIPGVAKQYPAWDTYKVNPEDETLYSNAFLSQSGNNRRSIKSPEAGNTRALFYNTLKSNYNSFCKEWDDLRIGQPYNTNSEFVAGGYSNFTGWKSYNYDQQGIAYEQQSSCSGGKLITTFYNNTGLLNTGYMGMSNGFGATWGNGSPWWTGVSANNFSRRQKGVLKPNTNGSYTFRVTSDNAVRLWINTGIVLNSWDFLSGSKLSTGINLTANKEYNIVLEYSHDTGFAFVQLEWSIDGGAYSAIPTSRFSSLYSPAQGGGSNQYGFTGSMTITNSGTQIDATPNAFSFNAITNAVLNSGYTSNAITVTGINTGTSISISNGRYRINAGGFTSTPGTVVQGDTVTVFLTSANSYSTLTSSIITIGGVTGAFTITTTGDTVDSTPNAFSFTTQSDVDLTGGFILSEIIFLTGYNTGITVFRQSGSGSFSINGGGFTLNTGTLSLGQSLRVRLPGPTALGTVSTITISAGGVLGSFTVISKAADTNPDAFSFNAITEGVLNSGHTSNAITVTGINTGTTISINRGLYRINAGGFTSTPGTVVQGDTVTVFLTSANSYSTLTSAVLTIGGVQGTFSVTTLDDVDSTPNAFTFGSINNVQPGTTLTTGPILLTGFVTGTNLTISNGLYSLDNSGFVSTPAIVNPGTQVRVRITLPVGFNILSTSTLTVGGVAGTFTATSRPRTLPTITNLSFITTPTTLTAFTGTAYSGDIVRLFINDGVYATGIANSSGFWAFSGMTLTTGQYNLYAHSRTPTTNILVGTSALVSITIGSGSLTGCIDNPEFSFLTEGATNVLCYETRRFRIFHPINNTQLSGSSLQTGDNIRIRIRYVNFSNNTISGKTFRIFNIPITTKETLQPQESGSAFLYMKIFKPQSFSGIVE